MSAVLTREQLRQRINLLEALETIMAAIDDVSGVEFEACEPHALDLHINTRDVKKSPVASARALPPEVVLAGAAGDARQAGGDAMNAAKQLSPNCELVLKSRDCYAESTGPKSFSIRDSEGLYLFSVSAGIEAGDLQSCFFYGARMRTRGQQEGRQALQSHLRELLNAAPLEPTT